MEFSRPEYWSGLPCPLPGDLPDPGIEPASLMSPAMQEVLTTSALMLGKIGGRRRRGQQRMRWLDGITDSMDMSFEQALGAGDGQGRLAYCSPWGRKESDVTE